MKSNYDVLGKYIQPIDVRNSAGKEDNLLGVTTQKYFMPSIANTVGTDFSKYKVVHRRQFTYVPDTSRRGDRIAIALLQDWEEGLVSNIYTVFEVTDEEKLLPEYLMLWFKRPEFDRYARFKSHGSVREIFDWSEMCKVELPVPHIEEQRRIVLAYETIERRIKHLRELNDNLEATATAYYHHLFDNTEGWQSGFVSDFGDIVGGGTPSKNEASYFCTDGIIWLTPKDLTSARRKFITKGETDITDTGYKNSSAKLMPSGAVLLTSRAPVGVVAIAENVVCTNQGFKSIVPKSNIGTAFVYYFLKENKVMLESHASGTTFMEISGGVLKSIPVALPPAELTRQFSEYCGFIFAAQRQIEQEVCTLEALAELSVTQLVAR
jgi:type I restriction enzyme S subunit